MAIVMPTTVPKKPRIGIAALNPHAGEHGLFGNEEARVILPAARAAQAPEAQVSVMSAEILLVLGALFCTVLGYFALQPAMEAARAGQGAWSFGAIHGASSALFALKGVLLLVLAWRATAPRVPL